MKKSLILLIAAISIIAVLFTKCSKSDNYILDYSIRKSNNFTNLPALQSFAFAKHEEYWIMIGGRTNGFHGFPTQPTPAFPYSNANKQIYVYNHRTNKLDSLSIFTLLKPLSKQYASSNMQHTQIGKYLYLCGGYCKSDNSFTTDSTISRINLDLLINKVSKNYDVEISDIFTFDSVPNIAVCATGGELIKLEDDYFYLTVGHKYYGEYSDTLPLAVQIYRDNVTAFKLIESKNSIKIDNSSIRTISDNLPDSSTQFRRRDLVVAPSILSDKKSIGISLYGGVFTLQNTTPFDHPIYITTDLKNPYQVDTFKQPSNHYSAAHFEMYSKEQNVMYTTIFGGIVDSFSDSSNASFTKKIITLQRDNKTNQTTSFYNITQLDTFIGSESVFIPYDRIEKYNNKYNIIDFDCIPVKNKGDEPVLVGCIYGGIISTAATSNQYPSAGQKKVPTFSSKDVYLVYVNKYSDGDESNGYIIKLFIILIIIIITILLTSRRNIYLLKD